MMVNIYLLFSRLKSDNFFELKNQNISWRRKWRMIFVFDFFWYTVENYKILIPTNKIKFIIQVNHNKSTFYRTTCNLIDIFNEFILQQKSVVFPPLLNLKWGKYWTDLVKKKFYQKYQLNSANFNRKSIYCEI
jgi:hypothetical protein